MLQNRHNTSDPTFVKRVTLQNLFRRPVDIIFSGDWDSVSYFINYCLCSSFCDLLLF